MRGYMYLLKGLLIMWPETFWDTAKGLVTRFPEGFSSSDECERVVYGAVYMIPLSWDGIQGEMI